MMCLLQMCMVGVFECFVAYPQCCLSTCRSACPGRVVVCVCNGMVRCVFAGARVGSPAAEEAEAPLVAMARRRWTSERQL